MTYRQLFKSFQSQLSGMYNSGEIESMFFLGLEHFYKLKRIDFIMQENSEVEVGQVTQFEDLILQLKRSVPIQYALGEAWFNDHTYYVDEGVLIPRSETEELVQLIKQMKPSAAKIIDIGTGSGCIAIELALLYNKVVSALDVSEKALKVARKNAINLNADISFVQQSILNDNFKLEEKFDIIVSNPPYVMESEKSLMLENVLSFEPKGALFVPDNDPLIFYKAIRDFALAHSKKDALIALEINEQLGKETAQLFEGSFNFVTVHKDIHEKDRFVTASYNGK